VQLQHTCVFALESNGQTTILRPKTHLFPSRPLSASAVLPGGFQAGIFFDADSSPVKDSLPDPSATCEQPIAVAVIHCVWPPTMKKHRSATVSLNTHDETHACCQLQWLQ
jgi:hypothetical protein